MSLTIVNSSDLGTPYECPLCRRMFYFEGDYVNHKCIAVKDNRGRRPNWMKVTPRAELKFDELLVVEEKKSGGKKK